MNSISDKSVDMILCDLPYGTTKCKWDIVLPFDKLWEQYNRIIKDNGAIVLFGTEPFSTELRHSNLEMYKYDWIWDKVKPNGHLVAKHRPMQRNENISVFGKGKINYYPIMIERDKPNSLQATAVVPVPINGSYTIPSLGQYMFNNCLHKSLEYVALL